MLGRGHDALKEKSNFLTIISDIVIIMLAPKTRENETRFKPIEQFLKNIKLPNIKQSLSEIQCK